ncbi:hypothetical protein H4R34_000291 [Dimargaris verticillata]|uniref:Conserved oligomeric Golgi complex subunit 5 n=1 Tax=Dimargaris verticillata TaxID=2761393 RepID=A0A9W8EG30_9FUNG|nr:hypothetical protein H4R34_000291 [Dimargaris verticillata]
MAPMPTSTGRSLDTLTAEIEALEGQIQSQILTDYESLLTHITRIKASGTQLSDLETRIHALHDVQSRLRHRVRVPYEHLTAYTAQLENLHAASDAVAYVAKYHQLAARLQGLLGPTSREVSGVHRDQWIQDCIAAAVTVSDIEALECQQPYKNTDAIASRQAVVEQLKSRLVNQADEALATGFAKTDSAQLALGAQLFHCLGQLPQRVHVLVAKEHHRLRNHPNLLVEFQSLATQPVGSLIPAIWVPIDQWLEELAVSAGRVYHLERTLARKRDAGLPGSLFNAVVNDLATRPVILFWNAVTDALALALTQAGSTASSVVQALGTHYPKLLTRLHTFFGIIAPYQRPIRRPGQEDRYEHAPENMLFLRCFAEMENQYVTRCESRLAERQRQIWVVAGPTKVASLRPLSRANPAWQPPSPNDVRTFVRALIHELEIVQFDTLLANQVHQRVRSQLDTFNLRIEELILTTPATATVAFSDATETVAEDLRTNLALCNALHTVLDHTTLWSESATRLPSLQLSDATGKAHALQDRILTPLFGHFLTSMHDAVVKLHSERAYRATPSSASRSARHSGYIIELAHKIKYVRKATEGLLHSPAKAARIQALCDELLWLVLGHVSLLAGGLSEPGKLQLTEDLTQLEFSLNQLLASVGSSLKDLGAPYHAVRELRTLVFANPSQVPQLLSTQLQAIPPYIVAQYLLSQANPPLPTPLSHLGLAPAGYLAWVREHSTAERQGLFAQLLDQVQTINTSSEDATGKAVAEVLTTVLHGVPTSPLD